MTDIALSRLSTRNLITTLVGMVVVLALAAAGWSLLSWTGFAESTERSARVLTLDGQQVTLPASDRPTVVYFFRPGCGCEDGLRQVAAARRQVPDALYVAVALDPAASPERLRDFVQDADGSAFAVVGGEDAVRFTDSWPAGRPGGYQPGSTLVLGSDGRTLAPAERRSTATVLGHVRDR